MGKTKKALLYILLFSFIIWVPERVLAYGVPDLIGDILNSILYVIVYALAVIAELISTTIFWAAEWSDFTKMDQIVKAWIVIRDFSNMLFIIILLVIAFGTILKLESYSYKKLLGRMVLMAVLVNFSKTICGIAIDAAQVFLFTFLSAMQDVKEAGLVQAFGLDDLLDVGYDSSATFDQTTVFISLFMAGAMLAVSCVVMLTYAVMFLLRIAMLWLLIVLSPLAYVLNVLPATQSYAKEWWKKFTNYVILGPMIGFFLWVAMFVATYKNTTVAEQLSDAAGSDIPTGGPASLTAATTPEMFANFLIATLLLLGGLQMTTSLASEFSKVTGKVTALGTAGMMFLGRRLDDIQNYGRHWGGKGVSAIGGLIEKGGQGLNARTPLSRISRGIYAAGKAVSKTGKIAGTEISLRPGEIIKSFKDIADAWDKERMRGRRTNLTKAMSSAMAPTRWAAQTYKSLMSDDIIRNRGNADDIDETLDAFNVPELDDLNQQWLDGNINEDEFFDRAVDVIDKMAQNEDGEFDAAKIAGVLDQLDQKIKTFQDRSEDLNYSESERKNMGETIVIMQALRGQLGDLQTEDQWSDVEKKEKLAAALMNTDDRAALGTFREDADTLQRRVDRTGAAGEGLSWYAGESSVDTEYMQSQIKDAMDKLKLETNNTTELVVNKLAQAMQRKDGAMISAALRSLWESNDFNELHQSPEIMKRFRAIVEANAKAQGLSGDDLASVMDHFEKNYTDAGYLQMFTKDVLTNDVFKGDKTAAVREDMRLGEISLMRAGGLTYGSSIIDGATGQGVFNDAEFVRDDDGNMVVRANAKQKGAVEGKTKNLNTADWSKSWHPNMFMTRGTDNATGGASSHAAYIMRNLDPEMFVSVKALRNDLKNILVDPKAMKGMLDIIKKSKGMERKRAMAFLASALGTGRGKFIDKQGARFAQNMMTKLNGMDDSALDTMEERLGNIVEEVARKKDDQLVALVGEIGIKEKAAPTTPATPAPTPAP